jgi:glycosyltransferase involved in cell wall biosynthesis
MTAPRILVIIPMYNCAPQIRRVLAQFTPAVAGHVSRVIVVNNRSTDEGESVAASEVKSMAGIEAVVVRNRDNYGLGGSHKVGFAYAMEHGFDRAVILHGDDQGSITDLLPHFRSGAALKQSAFLGARFMPGSRLSGYSAFRTFGNHVFNLLFSAVVGRRIYDLGSGLNVYDAAILRDGFYLRFPDDLTFNYCMIMAHACYRHDIGFFPISWREDDQISNVRLFSQARKVLRMLSAFGVGRAAFLRRELRDRPRDNYGCDVVAANFPA